jgi:hypothetical protein
MFNFYRNYYDLAEQRFEDAAYKLLYFDITISLVRGNKQLKSCLFK